MFQCCPALPEAGLVIMCSEFYLCAVGKSKAHAPGESILHAGCQIRQMFLKDLGGLDCPHHLGSSSWINRLCITWKWVIFTKWEHYINFSKFQYKFQIPVTLLRGCCLLEKPDEQFTYEYLPDIFLTTAMIIPARIPTATMTPIMIPTSAIVSRPPERGNLQC